MMCADLRRLGRSSALVPDPSDLPLGVRGTCPGVSAPMPTGDGLLLRLRAPLHGLTAAAARRVAAVARDCGNGQLELTMRGNLQIRGVAPVRLAEAQRALDDAGLGDTGADWDVYRNLIVSPASDLDPTAVADVSALAQAIGARIAGDPALRRLPAKIVLAVDGGGRTGIGDVSADLRLEAVSTGSDIGYRLMAGGPAETAVSLGMVDERSAPDAIARCLSTFLALRDIDPDPPTRIAGALAKWGRTSFDAALPAGAAEPAPVSNRRDPWSEILGPGPKGRWFGIGFAFGAMDAQRMDRLADLIDVHRTGFGAAATLRLTPWRALLLTGIDPPPSGVLSEIGGITDPGDPRLKIGACVGHPGCAAATVRTREAAVAAGAAASSLITNGAGLHVSGCSKKCGMARTVSISLTADGGRYEIGLPGPDRSDDWRDLTLEEACVRLRALDTVFARERLNGETMDRMITRLGRATLVDQVAREMSHV